MRKAWKKVCAGILCATMALAVMVPTTSMEDMVVVSAESDYDGEFTYQSRRYQYKNNGSSEITLINVLDQGGELSVPSTVTINGTKKTVTGLAYPFCGWQTYSKITIPNTVKKIDGHVFYSTTVDYLKLSDNLEEIGEYFCMYAKVNNISCNSKKLKLTENGLFCGATCPKKIIFGDWLVRWVPDSSEKTLDLTTSDIQAVKYIVPHCINFGENVNSVKVGKNNMFLVIDYYANWCFRNIENVYVDGKLVTCKNANDTVPKVIADNYTFFDYGKFNIKYAYEKAKYVCESLGIKYYGKDAYKYKGKLSASDEYFIARKLHNYIANNYIYDLSASDGAIVPSYGKTFNCHTVTKCMYDAQMYAFLLECAGVEAEEVYSQELIPISANERDQLLKSNPTKVTPDGKYKYGVDGDHAWNVVRIGGNLYYVDTTNDRRNDMYYEFLVSNDTIEKGKIFGDDTTLYKNPHYIPFHMEDKWTAMTFVFADSSLMLQVPNCNKIHGDIDMNLYGGDDEDARKLSAFIMLPDRIKNKIKNPVNGVISLTNSDIKTMNGSSDSRGSIQLIEVKDGNVKALFDYAALDVNFDGEIDMCDMIVLTQRKGSCLK